MRTALATSSLGGLIAAAAVAGPLALASIGAVLLVTIGAACWILTSPQRTVNAVAIVTAARGRPVGELIDLLGEAWEMILLERVHRDGPHLPPPTPRAATTS